MVKYLGIFLLVLLPMTTWAQLKHDANWCFGEGAGIYFENDGTLSAFNSGINSFETAACISSKNGELLFALQLAYQGSDDLGQLIGGTGIQIDNGDSLLMGSSITQGALFIPGNDTSTYYFYHLGYNPGLSSQGIYSIELYRTTIEEIGPGQWAVTQKNELMVQGPLQEKLTAVRAADGNCWWLVTHKETFVSCSNEFRLLKVCDGVIAENKSQNAGKLKCVGSGYVGELAFSPNGELLAEVLGTDSFQMFKFDRCVGELELIASIGSGYGGGSYGVAFSPNSNLIYIAEYRSSSDTSYLYQYSVLDSRITLLKKVDDPGRYTAQLELGADNKIYLAYCGKYCRGLFPNSYDYCLGVINNPDSLGIACDFEPFGYCFSDTSIKITFGLPNFPNYNLGPEGVFLANAGKDTVLCSNTNTTGVTIGVPLVPNVTYLWQPATGLSATNTAQPTANPAQGTWYFLTATDTTATSCAVNTDSVYVEVRTCVGITETSNFQAKLYPNPTTGAVTVELPGTAGGIFTLYNLLGQQVLEAPLTAKSTVLDIDASPSIYLYEISIDGHLQNGKLVVE